jgi:hypothetical protein
MQPNPPVHLWFMPFIFFCVFGIVFAIGNGFVARRLDKSVVLWVVLSVLPGINVFFLYYVFYAIVIGVWRRVNAIGETVGALPV